MSGRSVNTRSTDATRGFAALAIHGEDKPMDYYISAYRAFKKARSGHGASPAALAWGCDAPGRCASLARRLEDRSYRVGPYHDFHVYEPKERLVQAIDFEGKVAQHVLCDEFLYPAFTRRMVADNCAVQVGKGTHYGLARLERDMRHHFMRRKAADLEQRRSDGLPPRPMGEWDYAEGWVLKGDYSKYFYSLRHDEARRVCKRAVEAHDPAALDEIGWLLDAVIDSTPDPGIPIGNQSSQLIAILYADELDHIMKDELGMAYGRYMDDFYAISDSKAELRRVLKRIEAWSEGVGLKLNGKTHIFPLRNGVDYLGFHTYLTETGRVVLKVRAKSIDNEKRKIRKQRRAYERGDIDLEAVKRSYASWSGHVLYGDTYHLLQKTDAYLLGFFPELTEDVARLKAGRKATKKKMMAKRRKAWQR